MKEFELINNIIVKKPTEEQFKKILDSRDYFTIYGKKIIDSMKISLNNEEYFDLRILNELPKDYQDGIMKSQSHLQTTIDEMLTEVKKEYVKNTVKELENLSTVQDIEDKLDRLKGVFKKTNSYRITKLKDYSLGFFEMIDKERQLKSIKTKNWLKLNKMVKFYKGDITIVAGRPGAGKSAFALSLMLELAKNGNKGVFISLEMKESEIIKRLMSQISQVKLENILSNCENDEKYRYEFTNIEHERLQKGSKLFKELGDKITFVNDNLSSDDVLRIAEEEKPDYIIIDYMQLLTTTQGKNRVEEITYLSMELKRIAMKCNIHIFELCQLSRAIEQRADKRPILSDLRESGQLEQDASCVIGLYREGYYNEQADQNEMEIRILKNRNGTTGFTKYDFYGEIQKVTERV